ncbi:hypothetical protein PUN28_009921 [Cardiocondyla obscurior]|uniref:Secreted protein n=1 Tax=Cardiocondyla obscurior TaxID=286306 RepID=A0AAW2FQG3_9HYME
MEISLFLSLSLSLFLFPSNICRTVVSSNVNAFHEYACVSYAFPNYQSSTKTAGECKRVPRAFGDRSLRLSSAICKISNFISVVARDVPSSRFSTFPELTKKFAQLFPCSRSRMKCRLMAISRPPETSISAGSWRVQRFHPYSPVRMGEREAEKERENTI